MKTEHLGENLYDYVTGRMDDKDYHFAEEHLKGCEKCQKEVHELKETLKLLDQFQPPPLSDEIKEAVKQKLRKLPLPPKPLPQRLKEWIQIRPVKWGLAVATVMVLLTLTIYRNFTDVNLSRIEQLTKDIKIRLPDVKNPIIIEVNELDAGLEKLKEIIKSQDGEVLQVITIKEGLKITVNLEKDKEKTFFEKLNILGKTLMEKEGYRDEHGNIVVVLKKA